MAGLEVEYPAVSSLPADPADVYGQYIDKGFTMIQTDRPQLLIKYLDTIGRHTL